MGFKIISQVLLSRQQMEQAVREAEQDQEMYPDLGIAPPPDEAAGPRGSMRYYVHLIDYNPYQYLVFTVDEVMRVLRNHGGFNGSHEALCEILSAGDLPYFDDENMGEDDDDDG